MSRYIRSLFDSGTATKYANGIARATIKINYIVQGSKIYFRKRTQLQSNKTMPLVRVNLSNNNIELLNKIKELYKLGSRTEALEMVIKKALQDPKILKPEQEE